MAASTRSCLSRASDPSTKNWPRTTRNGPTTAFSSHTPATTPRPNSSSISAGPGCSRPFANQPRFRPGLGILLCQDRASAPEPRLTTGPQSHPGTLLALGALHHLTRRNEIMRDVWKSALEWYIYEGDPQRKTKYAVIVMAIKKRLEHLNTRGDLFQHYMETDRLAEQVVAELL